MFSDGEYEILSISGVYPSGSGCCCTGKKAIKRMLFILKVGVKVKWSIAVCKRLTATGTHHRGSHTVACHPAEVTFPPLPKRHAKLS